VLLHCCIHRADGEITVRGSYNMLCDIGTVVCVQESLSDGSLVVVLGQTIHLVQLLLGVRQLNGRGIANLLTTELV